MKGSLVLVLTAASALALCGTSVAAAPHGGGHAHHGGSCPGRRACACAASGCTFDRADSTTDGAGRGCGVADVSTIQGTASDVQVSPARGGRSGGVHVTLSSGQADTVDVHVGPKWFLDDKGYRIEKGDRIEVTGALVDVGDERHLVAREIRKNDAVLRLRDEAGVPLWSGGRGRN